MRRSHRADRRRTVDRRDGLPAFGLSLVAGDGFERYGRAELHFPPLIPLLLGGIGRLLPDPHTATVLVTIAAGTAALVPLALLARRLAGPPAGVATAWLAAVTPGLATLPVTRGAGSEAVYLLLLVTALWLVVAASDTPFGRTRLLRLGAAGGLVGLAFLARPEGLLLAVPLGVAVVVSAAAPGGRRRDDPLQDVARAGLAFALPLLACVVPYASYQHEHTGHWQVTSKAQDVSLNAWREGVRHDRTGTGSSTPSTPRGCGSPRPALGPRCPSWPGTTRPGTPASWASTRSAWPGRPTTGRSFPSRSGRSRRREPGGGAARGPCG